ncbi:ABC-type uncharacterized transport system [Planctomycetes bacterium Poly30]|uniref:ABC-type uncharacterized transport system n=1 Tax=Saltatorellus ferox TaxID=2528018 RepID=A0A518EU35_9BACT|nr:ABC-type uncharacterized transport system [Planctomycetes bacterium Poly30]
MNASKLSLIGLALGTLLFLAVNLFAGPALRGVRADLTEQKLYTLSQGTRNIVSDLEEPITLRLFFSKTVSEDYPVLLQYAERVQEMLEEFVAASDGKIDLEVIDPEPYSEAEELAVGYGIQGSPAPNGDMLYFGLLGTNSVDDEESLPGLDPRRESYLEYEVAEMIDKLERPDLAVVGLITSLPLQGGSVPAQQPGQPPQPTEPWPIMDLIQRRYEIRNLPPETLTEIPEDVDLLLMVHPKGLTPEGLYAVDQFCLKGGKVVAFVDSYCFFDPKRQANDPMAQLNAGVDSGIDELLMAWGVAMTQSQIVGDESTKLGVRGGDGRQVQIPVVFDVFEDTLDREDILTSNLKQLRFFMPGQLKQADEVPEGVNVTVLATTTEEGGGLVDSMTLLGGLNPQDIADGFEANQGKVGLAVRVSGTVKSAFPDGAPGAAEEENADGEEAADAEASTDEASSDHLSVATSPFNALVFSDADMLNASVWGQPMQTLFGGIRYVPQADNAALLVSALENLSGSNDLISLRSRAEYQRPFTRKQDLEAVAQERFRAEELELEAQLQETEAKLNEMQAAKDPSSAMLLSPEQEKEVEKFRAQQVETKRKLRKVKRDLRAEIDSLGTRLKFLNIFALPALIAALVAAVHLYRSGSRSSSQA